MGGLAVSANTAVMRPSPSFIMERQESLHNAAGNSGSISDSDDSDMADMNFVLAENSSLLGKELEKSNFLGATDVSRNCDRGAPRPFAKKILIIRKWMQ